MDEEIIYSKMENDAGDQKWQWKYPETGKNQAMTGVKDDRQGVSHA